jgi:eukaryotic-like serine/threonine-protein kinase
MLFQGQILGKYKILSPLGSGGFGTVYLARDTWIDKQVAIKVPHRQNLDFGDLLREPRLLASVSHPNIVAITTAEKQDGVFFIVMEYVQGETLETIIMREGALDLGRALDYACQICNAVDHAHRQGVLHRDLRPANVLVSDTGVAKVADFGTSRFLEIAAHGTTVIGSPPYMAPEQFQGRAVLASDIYSVGVILYQMLTGTLPYFSPNPAQIERLVAQGRCTAPRVRNSQIPREISDIVMKAIAVELHERYQRASEMIDDLATAGEIDHNATAMEDIRKRLKAREVPKKGFCWHCRKPLHARSTVCPFCGEGQ